jgi:hypothetical protein
MKKIILPWNRTHAYVGKIANNGIFRMSLCYRIMDDGRLNKNKPFTIVDHLVKLGQNVEKEGIAIDISGNPNNLDYDNDILFIPVNK